MKQMYKGQTIVRDEKLARFVAQIGEFKIVESSLSNLKRLVSAIQNFKSAPIPVIVNLRYGEDYIKVKLIGVDHQFGRDNFIIASDECGVFTTTNSLYPINPENSAKWERILELQQQLKECIAEVDGDYMSDSMIQSLTLTKTE